MKNLIITDFYKPEIGGTERLVNGLANATKSQVITAKGKYRGMEYVQTGLLLPGITSVHSINTLPCIIAGSIVSKLRGVKHIVSVFEFSLYENLSGGKAELFRRAIESADEVICLDEENAEMFRREYKIKSMNVIHSWSNYPVFSIEEELEAQREKGAKTSFLYVGRMVREKGIYELVDAFKSLKSKDIALKMVGAGQELETIKECAKDDPRIVFKGYLEEPGLAQVYSDCDYFVYPTQYSAALPFTAIDAISFGKPIVTKRTMGLKAIEVVSYFDDNLASGLMKAHNDLENYRKMKRDCFYLAKNLFDKSKQIKLYSGLYEQD